MPLRDEGGLWRPELSRRYRGDPVGVELELGTELLLVLLFPGELPPDETDFRPED
jgi:hypothetical protein